MCVLGGERSEEGDGTHYSDVIFLQFSPFFCLNSSGLGRIVTANAALP